MRTARCPECFCDGRCGGGESETHQMPPPGSVATMAAAAPDMLVALRLAEARIVELTGDGRHACPVASPCTLCIVRAALRKAEGR
jgi:hypothetical protein